MLSRLANLVIKPALALAVVGLLAGACTSGPANVSPAPTLDRPFIVGCTDGTREECDQFVDAIIATLAGRSAAIVVVEIGLYCPAGDHEPPASCPPALRLGYATVEFGGGEEPVEFELAGPPAEPRVTAINLGECPPFCWEMTTPLSARVTGAGPFAYTLGHCGLGHIVDFDGSFWVRVGRVDGSPIGGMSQQPGEMRLLGPNLAEYREDNSEFGRGTFVAQLARYPGPKFIYQWCA